jgi:zinc carboxypeptidase
MKKFLNIFIFILFIITAPQAQTQNEPYFKNGIYDSSIPNPNTIIGFEIGERPVRYSETVEYIKELSRVSGKVDLFEVGETHQGRKLYYLIITSPENKSNIKSIKENIQKLADPRKLESETEANRIIEESPAVAMMMYSIHGNESSGTDAAMQLAYQLAAGTDETTKSILGNLIVIIYPMENPDGRERFNNQLQSWSGKIKTYDTQSYPHSGVWPSARTNHYHFDLNRDWFILSQPESRSRVKVLLEWNPQLVVDAHEMGSFSTFLFNPPREPINPNLHKKIKKWWTHFAAEQSAEFDKYGWSYYTGEWLEEWYPGFGSSYPSYHGAISILYEQARTSGLSVKQPAGTVLTFRESVHHQFISSLANLKTTASKKEEILNDFYSIKKEALNKSLRENSEAFIINNDGNQSRINKLAEVLTYQGIDVFKTEENFTATDMKDNQGKKTAVIKLESGSLIIPVKQPAQNLIWAILEFDVRMDNNFLKSERESLIKGEGTRLYEVSAWSMSMAYGLKAYISGKIPSVKKHKFVNQKLTEGKIVKANPAFGYLINYNDDNAVRLLINLLEKGLKVRTAEKKFSVEGKFFERGTLLLRKNENDSELEKHLTNAAEEFGINIYGVNTALSQTGSDLGGGYFTLLHNPRTAILVGNSINLYNFGATWFTLDNEYGLKTSLLRIENLRRYDLRKYNVIILPAVWGGKSALMNMLTKSGTKKLKDWMNDGGTLISIGSSSAALADTSSKFSKVSLRRQALNKLEDYSRAMKNEYSKNVTIDSLEIWEGTSETISTTKATNDKVDLNLLKEKDANKIKFMPRGTILNVDLNEESWLTYGVGSSVPAILYSNYSLLSKTPVQTIVRFADEKNIRLSGLIWKEAKERLANTAYLTREKIGNGQLILFAGEPNFRAYFHGTTRLLLNAILFGPGFGANQPVEF